VTSPTPTLAFRGARWDPIWGLAALLALANLVPLFSVPDPPLQDYPAHLVRAHLFVAYDAPQPGYAEFFTRSFLPAPYVLADWLTLVLAQLVPLALAGKIVLGLCVTLVPASVVHLLGAIHRDKRVFGLAAFAAAYHWPFQMGFVSYSLSLAPAFFALALWFRRREDLRRRDGLALAGWILLCYLAHLFTFAVLTWLLLVAALLDSRRRRHLPVVLATLTPPALLFVLVRWLERASGASDFLVLLYEPLQRKLERAAECLLAMSPAAEAQLFAALGLVLLPFIALGVWRREARRPLGLALAALALYLALPDHLGSHGDLLLYVAIRVPLLGAALLLALAAPPRPAWGRAALATVLVGFALVRVAQLTSLYRGADHELAAYRAALASLPADARPQFRVVRDAGRRGRILPTALFGNYFFLRATANDVPRLDNFVGPLRTIAYRHPSPTAPGDTTRLFRTATITRARHLLVLGRRPEGFDRAAAAVEFEPAWTAGGVRWLSRPRERPRRMRANGTDYLSCGYAEFDHLVLFRRSARQRTVAPPGFVELFSRGQAVVLRRVEAPAALGVSPRP